jgi:hypothetical protein
MAIRHLKALTSRSSPTVEQQRALLLQFSPTPASLPPSSATCVAATDVANRGAIQTRTEHGGELDRSQTPVQFIPPGRCRGDVGGSFNRMAHMGPPRVNAVT